MRDVRFEPDEVGLLVAGLKLLRKEAVRTAAETPAELPSIRLEAENVRGQVDRVLGTFARADRVYAAVRPEPGDGSEA